MLSKNDTLTGQLPSKSYLNDLYMQLLVLSSVFIITGLIWDFSWHISIGRDSQFSPPHLFLYAGGLVAGLASGYKVIKISFFGTAAERSASVRFWKIFYSPLGGLLCIWGAFSMMTSAPFDDWWHNTYGLDVKVLSPPHILLIGGMVAIQLGSCICVSAANAFTLPNIKAPKTYHLLFAIAAGSVISTVYFLFFNAFFLTSHTHNGNYYFHGALIFTGCLVMVSRASNYKWAATAAAGVYMAEYVIMLWLLPLFPASPLVGPVYNHFDHYQPLGFPLLLIFPAITIDIVINQVKHIAVWIKIPLAALLFLGVFFVVQWCFGEFYLTSEYSRNWLFGSYSLGYYGDPDYKYRYAYDPWLVESGKGLLKNLIYAGIAGTISASVGYVLGSWLKRVKR